MDPQAKGLKREESPQRIWPEVQQGLITRIPHDWGKTEFLLLRVHARSCVHQNPGEKKQDFVRIESDLFASSGESLVEEVVGQLWLTVGTKTLVVVVLGVPLA